MHLTFFHNQFSKHPIKDVNECRYRPCSVFGVCTNTPGSFSCSCRPGFKGDGFNCTQVSAAILNLLYINL